MNILIVLKRLSNDDTFFKVHELLLKHAENWTGKDNDVYVLSGVNGSSYKNSNIHFVNPPGYLVNNLLVSFWFSMVNHPRFDFVIEELAVIPFIYKKSEKIFYVPVSFQNSLKIVKVGIAKIFTDLIVRFFYKDSYFFVDAWNSFYHLHDLGVKERKIHLLKEGINFGNSKRSKMRTGKNLLFISGSDVGKVQESLQVFMAIERRDLDWKFTAIVPESLAVNAKRVYADSGLVTPVKVVSGHSSKTIQKEIENTNIILDLDADGDSLTKDLLAFYLKIPVIAIHSEFLKSHTDIARCFLIAEKNDYFSIAQKALDMGLKEKEYSKKMEYAEELVKNYSAKSLTENSMNFLLSIRPNK